jgi:chromosome segregation ATPase
MRNTFQKSVFGVADSESDLHQSIKNIEQHLVKELQLKQKALDEKKSELSMLHFLMEEKNQAVLQLQGKIGECQQNIEGNRQLINKLLNDQARLQQDIEWYKRTYETRTIFGLIKDRLKYFFSK